MRRKSQPRTVRILHYFKAAMTGSEMFGLSRVFKAEPKPQWAAEQTQLLTFDAHRIVAGIRFHVLDFGIGLWVDEQSWAAAESILRQRAAEAGIAQSQWSKMTDIQRLNWLLEQGHLVVSLGAGGVAILNCRGEGAFYGHYY
jgi:hypothetical protein